MVSQTRITLLNISLTLEKNWVKSLERGHKPSSFKATSEKNVFLGLHASGSSSFRSATLWNEVLTWVMNNSTTDWFFSLSVCLLKDPPQPRVVKSIQYFSESLEKICCVREIFVLSDVGPTSGAGNKLPQPELTWLIHLFIYYFYYRGFLMGCKNTSLFAQPW